MSILVNAAIRAVPNFLDCLQSVRRFMVEQDARSADARFQKLQTELVRARALLAFAPASGRPARFLEATSGWGLFEATQAKQLAASLGTPGLRELVLSRHVLVYAHSSDAALLLSIRDERLMGYQMPGSGQ